MNIFLDTSSLFKLYHKETGTAELLDFFEKNEINGIFLAEVTKVEFSSTVWKKCRKKDLSIEKGKLLINKFQQDSSKFSFISQDSNLVSLALVLLEKHWQDGLRTLDALQLASSVSIKDKIDKLFTSDIVLRAIAENEGFNCR
ncbi:type II toxin-antitoxin system VapC family toxin [Mariniradius saccharolyticus]|uniref:type II toxin-antitoxin system VapC family toxin n=1 Tax=Mariniradius saccharolyticus TaxID=1245591 RepID=UPI0002A6F12F|nr:type II toxin-antitoxin system VapC family toxin [Mariniradius saccharolyticus]